MTHTRKQRNTRHLISISGRLRSGTTANPPPSYHSVNKYEQHHDDFTYFMTKENHTTSPSANPNRISLWHRLRFLPVAIIFAALAITTFIRAENRPADTPRFIKTVKLTKTQSLTIDPSTIINSDSDQDFYIVITLNNGKTVQLPTKDNALIGNGLSWNLQPTLPLKQITELSAWDEDPLSDDHLDRVSMDGNSLSADGQHYRFELIEDDANLPKPGDPRVIWSIISGSGIIALLAAVFFVRDQALNEVPVDD